jgi:hypothetical protein
MVWMAAGQPAAILLPECRHSDEPKVKGCTLSHAYDACRF